MKTNKKRIILSVLFLAGVLFQAQAQVQYSGCTVTGTNASAIGKNNKASGNNSFAAGYNTQSSGSNSLAFGYNSKATKSTTTAMGNTATASGIGSMALGNYVMATAQNSFVIGSGATASYPLTNDTENSIALGTNSNTPTMLITKSLNNNYTGKVAIGQVTTPQAKLHVRSDNNEDAGVFIEPSNTDLHKAFIKLFDSNHGITVDKTSNMELHSGDGAMLFKGASYGFGSANEKKVRLYTSGTPAFYVNATRLGGLETRGSEGSSFAIDFSEEGMRFRGALKQTPRGSEITNWKTHLFLSADGKVTIGSTSTDNITIMGKVGINTVNTTNGYALAVDGGLVTTKVYIKEVKLWPDYVFDEDYSLMELEELRRYLKEKHHLPGMPSDDEVMANGYDVNEMQTLMMEKIEELTRYILFLQEEIDGLKSSAVPTSDSVVFSYDSNGNRTSRSLIFQKVESPGLNDPAVQVVSCELFPNPTPGEFTLFIHGDEQKAMKARLLNSLGVIISERVLESSQTSFDLSGQPEGVYLLEIGNPDGRQTWKIIKQ